MNNNFAFLALSETITGIITLPHKAKKDPFIIVNTDHNRGLYIKKLEQKIAEYGLISKTGDSKFHDIETSNLIIFGDSTNFDYRVEMNYLALTRFADDVRSYDLVDDYASVIKKLALYCKHNDVRKYSKDSSYCCPDLGDILHVRIQEEPKRKSVCPLFARPPKEKKKEDWQVFNEKYLVNIYDKPNYTVEDITVHSTWVKIGWDQYDIFVDLFGNEFIILDGDKVSVKSDRFGRRYLAV